MRTPDVIIKHIKQQCEKSCVIACIAMVTGKPFNEINKQVEGQGMKAPLIPDQYMDILVQNNIFPNPISANAPSPFIHGELYLVTVASLNHMSGLHMVVIDYRSGRSKVYDPQEGRTGKWYTTDDWNGVGENDFPWCNIVGIYDSSPKI